MVDDTIVVDFNGTPVKFGKRDKMQKLTLRSEDGQALGAKFLFRNGKEYGVTLQELPPNMVRELACHGLKQKLGDEGARKDVNTTEDLILAIDRLARRLLEGEWTNERGERQGGNEWMLAKAIAEIKGKSVAEIQGSLKDRTAKEKAALRLVPQVAELLRKYAEEQSTDVDADELLAGL